MKTNKLSRVSNYARHIAFCFANTRYGSYRKTVKIAVAYLGLHLNLFKGKAETLKAGFKDFNMELNIYSREVAGYWEIFQEHQYLDVSPALKNQKVVVLDIGANVGFFAVSQALQHRSDLKLIAFEPDPKTYDRLLANTSEMNARFSSDISCYNCAVDTHIGEAKFVQDVSVESHVVDENTTSPCIIVQLTTLDFVVEKEGLEKIDLLKIDVEGHEMKVLEGGKKCTLPITDSITLEYHGAHFVDEIARFLAPFNFKLVNHNVEKSILSYRKNVPAFA